MNIPELIPSPKESKSIESIGYSNSERAVYILFKRSGELFKYADFPPSKYQKFLEAKSIGNFVSMEIIPNHYPELVTLEGRTAK